MESCIPAVRGLEFVQKCLQLRGICEAAIGKDSSLQLSPFWLLLLWTPGAEVFLALSEAEAGVWWGGSNRRAAKTSSVSHSTHLLQRLRMPGSRA